MDTRTDLLDPAFPGLALGLLAVLGVAMWFASHALRHRIRHLPYRLAYFVLRCAIGSVALGFCWQLLARLIHLATDWTLTSTAILGALLVELAAELFRHERGVVSERRGRALQSLRAGAILTVIVILLQPMSAFERERQMQRQLVILIDDSASMGLADQQLDVSEKLRVAALFGVPAARRNDTLTQVQRSLALLDKRIGVESGALQVPEGVSKAAANALVAKRSATLRIFLEQASRRVNGLARIVANQRGRLTGLSRETSQLLEDYDRRIRENVAADLKRAAIAIGKGEYDSARGTLHGISRQIRFILDRLPAAAFETDALYYAGLDEASKREIDSASTHSRAEIAREILRRRDAEGQSIVDRLGADYQLRFIRFAEGAAEIDGESWLKSGDAELAGENFRRAHEEEALQALAEGVPDALHDADDPGTVDSAGRTDFAGAFDTLLEKVPAHDLAGVLVLSDGRHNGEQAAEEGARRLGLQDVPICPVVVGSRIGPRDAAVLAVRTPESIYLEDRAIIQADLKLDGLRGQSVTATLSQGGREIGRETIEVGEQSLRTTLRFAHRPQEIGIFQYEVVIDSIPGEVFPDNNRWRFQVAVTDDRTNVLLVDGYPRWEFRYLRNLFYARDKSVHLQHVLLAPDRIAGDLPPPLIPASASRRFGDAEATALPESREEWLKFDAFILGDIPPDAITAEQWQAIRYAVAERGALLVTIAGPRFMPHAFDESSFLEMLPASFGPRFGGAVGAPEAAYRLRLSTTGRGHLIMQQSLDPDINAIVWDGLPPLYWRHPVAEVKEAAEVLAWAEPITGTLRPSAGSEAVSAQQRRTAEREGALVLSQRYGIGRSLLINFDQTWRLRYGVGDVHHHKFWGQILRWGTGENLRAGTDLVRLGTDRLSYASTAEVSVLAKVLDERHQPVIGKQVSVALYQSDEVLIRRQLEYREESNGIYEGKFQAPEAPGRYRLALEGRETARILETQNVASVETEIIVNSERNAIELAELTADTGMLGQLAALSGGAVADPDDAASLLPFFRDPGRVVVERREATLWDNYLLLIPLFVVLGIEWWLRRQSGLA